MHAYCFASGHIEFSTRIPEGALPIANGPERELRDFISPLARHAYDNETLLVPGVPEAEDQEAKLDALKKFVRWISEKAPRGINTIYTRKNR